VILLVSKFAFKWVNLYRYASLVFAPCSPLAGAAHFPPVIMQSKHGSIDDSQYGACINQSDTREWQPYFVAGGKTNWIAKSNEEIIAATMVELERLFPLEIGPGSPDGVGAVLLKHAVVKTPRSVYAAIPGRNKYRPSQATPISNFTLAGDWTSQKFLVRRCKNTRCSAAGYI
jgi:hypothetical protein